MFIAPDKNKRSLFWLLAVAHLFALPFASPFANAGQQSLPKRAPRDSFQHNVSPPNDSKSHRNQFSRLFRAVDGTNDTSGKTTQNWLGRFILRSKATPYDIPQRNDIKAKTSLLSRFFFNYATPLVKKAAAHRLDQNDAFEVPVDEKMVSAVSRFNRIHELTKESTSRQLRINEKDPTTVHSQSYMLAKSLLYFTRRSLLLTGCLRFLNTAIQAFPPILVARLLRLVEAGNAYPAQKAFLTVASLILVLTVKTILENAYFDLLVRKAMQVRGILAGMIFDKSMRLSSTGVILPNKGANQTNSVGVGEVLNLMQSDTSLIESFAMQIHTTWE